MIHQSTLFQKTPVINVINKKIFYVLNTLVPIELSNNPNYKLLSDYNKIKEEELLEEKSNDKENIDKEVIEKPKTKRKYTKKNIDKTK